jgi:hypothetical protein
LRGFFEKILFKTEVLSETGGRKRSSDSEADKNYKKLFETCRRIGSHRNGGHQSDLYSQCGREGATVFTKYWKGLDHGRIFHAPSVHPHPQGEGFSDGSWERPFF